jgi:aspartate/methionine/tyrosine aminotransferase
MTFISDIVSRYVHESEISAIKEMSILAAKMPDAVSLTWGLPSFATPAYIRDAVTQSLAEDPDAGKYTLPDGLAELRQQVVKTHYRRTGIEVDADSNVMICAGNMQGLNTLFHTMLDPQDEIILTDPCFASHIQQITLFSGIPVYWPLDKDNDWALDVELLPELINDRTQAIVIVSPSNPTGSIFSEQSLRRVGEVARAHDILIIIDDPYSDFVYDREDAYYNLASDPGLSEHMVYLYSFSKAYAMSGWRLSYVIMPEELKREAMKVHDATMICAPRISQLAGIAALEKISDHKQVFRDILRSRRELICQRLDELPDIFSYSKPQGAYYIFPEIKVSHVDSKQFALDLLQQAGVAVTPGSAFGPSGEHHVRMAYCVEDDIINQAFDRIKKLYR